MKCGGRSPVRRPRSKFKSASCAFLNGGCRFTQFSRLFVFAPTSANGLTSPVVNVFQK